MKGAEEKVDIDRRNEDAVGLIAHRLTNEVQKRSRIRMRSI